MSPVDAVSRRAQRATGTKQILARWLDDQKSFLSQQNAFSRNAGQDTKALIDGVTQGISEKIALLDAELLSTETPDDSFSEKTKERVFGLVRGVLETWETFVNRACTALKEYSIAADIAANAFRVDPDPFKGVIVNTRTEVVQLMQGGEPLIAIWGLSIKKLKKQHPEFFDEDELKRLAGDSTDTHDIAPYAVREERSEEYGVLLIFERAETV